MRGIYTLGIIVLTIISCNFSNINYAKAAKKDTERIFKSRKSLLPSLAFNGIISDKVKCEKCNMNKFTIDIWIEEMIQKVSFQDEKFPSYYSFEDKVLSLTVNQKVFENLKRGDLISNMPDSRYLKSNNRHLEILHSEERMWLP